MTGLWEPQGGAPPEALRKREALYEESWWFSYTVKPQKSKERLSLAGSTKYFITNIGPELKFYQKPVSQEDPWKG